MKFSATTLEKRHKADALIVPCWQGKSAASFAVSVGHLGKRLAAPIELGDFSGRAGETMVVYIDSARERRAILVGLGEEKHFALDHLRRSYAHAVKLAMRCRIKSLSVLIPKVAAGRHGTTRLDVVRVATEGLLRANYVFAKKEQVPVAKAALIGVTPKELAEAKEVALIGEGVNETRDLILDSADVITPQKLAAWARALARKHEKVKTTIFDRKRIEKEGMELLLAVGRGSPHDPVFIQLAYRGKPTAKEHTVIVGKGVTYDTGGLRLKPASNMESQRTDMSGAGIVLGTIAAVAALKLPVNVTAVVAATENAIDGKSYKIGDVYRSYSGKTVEVVDTDAEGRLTLADALAYAGKKLKPTRMIDLATLTGSIVIALGEEVAAVMSPDEKLVAAISKSGERVGEAVWRMPLVESYRTGLKSDIADLKNVGPRPGGGITAGLFLQEFVGDIPWAHLDIAGVAYTDKPLAGNRYRATGFGVRLLVDLLKQIG